MTEQDAIDLIESRVPRETFASLEALAALVEKENSAQNLIAQSTIAHMWTRHILDSVQLLWLAERGGLWLDIGSGGGFPGLVVALLREDQTVLVEPRAKRAEFLARAAEHLGMQDRTIIVARKMEQAVLPAPARIISARAVAALPALFTMACPVAAPDALWLLPKGRSAEQEVAEARREWQGVFETRASLSDSESRIVVATQVKRKPVR